MINERLQKMNREQFFAEEDKKKKFGKSGIMKLLKR